MHHDNKKSFSCSDMGMSCDFHVCGSEESEVIAAAQEHGRRAHGKDVSAEQIREHMKSGAMAECPS